MRETSSFETSVKKLNMDIDSAKKAIPELEALIGELKKKQTETVRGVLCVHATGCVCVCARARVCVCVCVCVPARACGYVVCVCSHSTC